MVKNAGSSYSADELLQIAGQLRIADRLVRERQYSRALEQIARVRTAYPASSYARAYEERVRLLISTHLERESPRTKSPFTDSLRSRSFSEHLESIAAFAPREPQRAISDSTGRRGPKSPLSNFVSRASDVPHQTLNGDIGMSERSELQIRKAVRSAQALIREGRLDEAQNTLMPAILVDPVNSDVVLLQQRIREAWGDEISDQLQIQSDRRTTEDVAHSNQNQSVHDYISVALKLAGSNEFPDALATLGRGYLIDPMNEDLAACEELILKALAQNSSGGGRRPATRESIQDRSSEKRQLLQHLDSAQQSLEADQFGEALTHVALAMMAFSKDPLSEEQSCADPASAAVDVPDVPLQDSNVRYLSQVNREIAAQILTLIDEAKRLDGMGQHPEAVGRLVRAAAMIPADGSLAYLDRIIGRKFMEYALLTQALKEQGESKGTAASPQSSKSSIEVQSEKTKNPDTLDSKSRYEAQSGPSLSRIEPESDANPLIWNEKQNQITTLQVSISRSLRFLNATKLNEAAIEATNAAAVDASRSDVETFANGVAELAQKAGNRVVFSSLSQSSNSVRQQAMDILHNLWYEELLLGIDKCLELVPESEILLKRRAEVEEFKNECKNSIPLVEKGNGLDSDTMSKMSPAARKTRKRPLDQMDLSFSNEQGRRAAQGWS